MIVSRFQGSAKKAKASSRPARDDLASLEGELHAAETLNQAYDTRHGHHGGHRPRGARHPPARAGLLEPEVAQCYTHTLAQGARRGWPRADPLVVDTGRTPAVRRTIASSSASPASEERIAWGNVNVPISEETFEGSRPRRRAARNRRRLRGRRLRGRRSRSSTSRPGRHRVPVARALRAHALHRPEPSRSSPTTGRRRSSSMRLGRGRSGRGRDAQRDVRPPAPRRAARC